MKQTAKTKFLSMLLVFCMVFAMMPTMSFAASTVRPWLWVNGVQVTESNLNNVLGDGTVLYDVNTNTLTLKNANITKLSGQGGDEFALIYAKGTPGLKINLVGTTRIYNPLHSGNVSAIKILDGNLDIVGNGELYIDMGKDCNSSGAIWLRNTSDSSNSTNLSITNSKVHIATAEITTSPSYTNPGVFTVGDIKLSGNADVTVFARDKVQSSSTSKIYESGLYASTLTVADNAKLEVIGAKVATTPNRSYYTYGIAVTNLIQTGGEIKVTGGSRPDGGLGKALDILNSAKMTGGTLIAEGTAPAINRKLELGKNLAIYAGLSERTAHQTAENTDYNQNYYVKITPAQDTINIVTQPELLPYDKGLKTWAVSTRGSVKFQWYYRFYVGNNYGEAYKLPNGTYQSMQFSNLPEEDGDYLIYCELSDGNYSKYTTTFHWKKTTMYDIVYSTGNLASAYINGEQKTDKVKKGDTFTLPKTTTFTVAPMFKDDYTFKGWSLSKDGATGLITTIKPTGDTNVYAIWEKTVNLTDDTTPQGIKQREYIVRLYDTMMHRTPTTSEVDAWQKTFKSGNQTVASILHFFIHSPEYVGFKRTNEQFVQDAYAAVFGRAPDASGQAYWMSVINKGVSFDYLASQFTGTKEFAQISKDANVPIGKYPITENRDKNINVTAFVVQVYDKVLGRSCDTDGLNYWTGEILAGRKTPVDAARSVVYAPEFTSKNYNNTQYLQVMYAMFFNRPADNAGINYWLGQMQAGMTRETVLDSFAYSTEFAEILKGFGI